MREMVRTQTAVGGDAAGALEEAQTAIIQLFRWEPRFYSGDFFLYIVRSVRSRTRQERVRLW